METPASPPQHNTILNTELISSPSKSTTETNFELKHSLVNPKVIPLEKVTEVATPTSITTSTTSTKKIDQEESSLTLLDLISKMQEKLITASNNSNTMTKTPVQHILSNLTAKNQTNAQSQPQENSNDYTYIENIHGNLNYNLWIINTPSQTATKPIRILIRNSISGYVNTESSSRSSVCLHSKLEYQTQFGCEKLNHKDYCFMWAKSLIRNNCDVLLCRINVYNSKLINIKTLSHKDILTGYSNFNPQQEINNFKNFIEKLLK